MIWPYTLLMRKVGPFSFLMVAFSSAAVAACTDSVTTLQAAQISNRSEWNEFDAAGRNLVHESGTLRGTELGIAYQCDRWHLAAQISDLSGSRLYDGQTNNGTPATSQSAITERQGHLQSTFALIGNWQIGGRLANQTISRDIASSGSASGYPERFDWTLLSIGVQWQSDLGPGKLTLVAWSGTQLQSNMQITLPGRDQTTLQLGSIRQLDLTAGWRTQLSPAWHLQADIGYRRTEIGEGAETVINRSGFPIGVVHQPRSIMVSRPVSIQIGYYFK